MQTAVNGTIKKLIEIIAKHQLPNGGFLSFSSSEPENFSNSKIYQTTFTPSLILSSLVQVKDIDGVNEVKKKVADFLLSERSDHWSFNYWSRSTDEFRERPYPDDLDDTFCALSALYGFDKNIIDGEALANSVMLLTAAEVKEGGPYRTWLVDGSAPEVWRDVDLAVNCNVAYFLSLQGVELPELDRLIESAIDENKFASPYYPPFFPIVYFISRFYKGDRRGKITDLILKNRTGSTYGNILNTSLAVSSLLNLDFPHVKMNKEISYLIEALNERPIMPYAFCIDPSIDDKKFYSGSSSLTAAFCVEALSKFSAISKDKKHRVVILTNDSSAGMMLKKINNKFYKRIDPIDAGLKRAAKRIFDQTVEKDEMGEIVMLPYFFKRSMDNDSPVIDDDTVVDLCLANIYGWIAYTVYDDFFDDEGRKERLSFANLALREMTAIYSSVSSLNREFKYFFHETMDMIDSTNMWEISNCRMRKSEEAHFIPETFPKYDRSKLYGKSLGHSLAGASILFFAGYGMKSNEMKNLIEFFKNYLIARQLNDDMHDWEEDLKKGHLDIVNTAVIERWNDMGGSLNSAGLLRDEDFPELQKLFWMELAPDMCDEVRRCIKDAKKNIGSIGCINDQLFLHEILDRLFRAADKAMEERDLAMGFIRTYSASENG